MKGKQGISILLSAVAGLSVIALSMFSLSDGLAGWSIAHGMGWMVWVTDLCALAIAGLAHLASSFYFQAGEAREESQERLESSILQVQLLEQENGELRKQRERLEAELETLGIVDPFALLEARQRAETLQQENSELRAALAQLVDANAELEERLLRVEARFLESEELLTRALTRLTEIEENALALHVAPANLETLFNAPRSIQAALSLVQQLERENNELSVQVQSLAQENTEGLSTLHRATVELKEQNRALQTQVERIQAQERETREAQARRLSAQVVETLMHEIESALIALPQTNAPEKPAESAERPDLEIVTAIEEAGANVEAEDLIYLHGRSLRSASRYGRGGRARRPVRGSR